MRTMIHAVLVCLTILALPAAAEYTDGWGPAIGSRAPSIEARDQSGQLRRFDDLKGEHGLLLFMSRSADW